MTSTSSGNLIIQSMDWLKGADHLKSIKDKTSKVLKRYRKYVEAYPEDYLFEVPKSTVLAQLDTNEEIIHQILRRYLMGDHAYALDQAKDILERKGYFQEDASAVVYFRARANDTGFLYSQKEMYHIPFDRRAIISNQRYSVTGLPCMYLGGSTYICWEELGRPDYKTCNFCGFKNKGPLYLYDFVIPPVWNDLNDVYRVAIILACSIKSNPNDIFKQEYILPQCFLQAIIDKHIGDFKNVYGIKYLSVKLLNQSATFFEYKLNELSDIRRYVNYVFPAVSSRSTGISKELQDMFDASSVMSIMQHEILDPLSAAGGTGDMYLDSSFGFLDNKISECFGMRTGRRDLNVITYDVDD